MSEGVYPGQAAKTARSCEACGRKLGVGYYFTCHVCGRSYCYAHIPVKCTHAPLQTPRQTLPARVRR